MATAQVNQKVFVSPGVYTSETDLSFVAQSVGVTTLGLVGETIKGPAFEPVFITNYDEFQAYFGGTEPVKFVNTQIPQYEAAYIAKSYLQQSNQLFVTRVLGLSGYDAGPSWSIRTTANVDPTTIGLETNVGQAFAVNFSGNSSGDTFSLTGDSVFNDYILPNLYVQYRMSDGSTSNLFADFSAEIDSIAQQPSLSATTVAFYGAIPGSDYWPIVTQYSNQINEYLCDTNNLETNDLSSNDNDAWFYANFDNYSGNDYSGYSFYYSVTNIVTGATGNYTGTFEGNIYTFSGTAYSEFNNMVIATLRSRGISLYANSATSDDHGPIYEVSGLTDLDMVCSGQYSGVTQSPYETFLLSGVTKDGNTFQLESSLSAASSKYITKVLGLDNFGKSRFETPVFVEEIYPGTLNYAYNQGYIKGLNCELVGLPSARREVLHQLLGI
jgi:hypothetical protein